MREKELLFSVTKDDFTMQTFRAGGKGGQNQNKVNSGVRLIHNASGARGESRDQRTFARNRVQAFQRLIETAEFKAWFEVEKARKLGQAAVIDQKVNESLNPRHIKVEVRKNGKWVDWND